MYVSSVFQLQAGVSTTEEGGLKFLYENDEDFSALPTFAVIPAQMSMGDVFTGGELGLDIDLSKVCLFCSIAK